nr:SseB family protein [Micromonospora sp. NBS 11-29]
MRTTPLLGRRVPTAPSRRPATGDRAADGSDADALDGWLTDLRHRPDEPDPFAAGRAAPVDAPPAGQAPPPARSFFEPTSGRSSRRSSPLDAPRRATERATPPSRFAGGQPFPRRRPLNEPVPEDPTRAFPLGADEPTPAPRPAEPAPPFRPARPPEDADRVLPRRHSGPPAPASDEWSGAATPDPGASRWQAPEDPAEALPPSIAEPVSAPPAPRRDFTPIVIEGTVLEARDLTEPAATWSPSSDPTGYAVPVATAAGAPAAWAGSTESTLPIGPPVDRAAAPILPPPAEPASPVVEPATSVFEAESPVVEPVASVFEVESPEGEPTVAVPGVTPVSGGVDDRTVSLGSPTGPASEPTVSLFEPTTPFLPAAAPDEPTAVTPVTEPTTAPFDTPGSSDEVTTSLFGSGSSDEPTTSLFGPVSPDEATTPLFPPAPSDEPTASLFGPGSSSDEPTTSLFGPGSSSDEPTTSLFGPGSSGDEATTSLFQPVSSGEPTVSLSDSGSSEDEPTASSFRPAPSDDEPTTSLFGSGSWDDESTVSLSRPAVSEPTVSLFGSVSSGDEPTTSLFGSVSSEGEPTASLPTSGSSEGEPTASLPTSGSSEDEPTASLFRPASSEPTVSLFEPGTPGEPAASLDRQATSPAAPAAPEFVPANEVEEELLAATGSGSTDGFLTTLLLARVLLPVAPDSVPGSRPGHPGFVWRTESVDGGTYVVVYTSPERLAEHADGPVDTVRVKFVQLIRRWPDVTWSFLVNPGSPVGAAYPGEQVLALANWAAEVGLGDDPETEPEASTTGPESAAGLRSDAPAVTPGLPVTMQKAIAASQLAYYLERGYDRVSGFVHRAGELAHLRTPAQLYDALGLGHPASPFSRDDEEIHLLRWPAYRPSLYRIPYGGQTQAAMRAMEGWVIERPPFRGNGFAPGEGSDVIAEFKVDSARLPHGAELWRIGADGDSRLVAVLDTDALVWRKADEA